MHKNFHIIKTSLALILLLQVFSLQALAEDTQTCYSVQLASVYNKNSIYLNEKSYPQECKVISLTNLKAIRCGCFDEKEEARTALKHLRSKYRGAILVKNFKSRFQQRLDIATEEKLRSDEETLEEATAEEKHKEERQEFEHALAEEELSPDLLSAFLDEGDFSVQGNVNASAQSFIDKPDGKNGENFTLSGELEFEYSKNDITLFSKIYAQGDSTDLQGSSKQNDRSFVRLDELYIKRDFENDQIMFGKSVRFWGSLEVRNIADVFNPTDLRTDIFDSSKIGVWNTSYTHYTETGELSIIVKLNEPDRDMAAFPYVYYFFPENFPDGNPLSYDNDLKKELSNRPSFFVRYSGSTDTEYPLDFTLIYQNGYDSQSYFTYTPDNITNPTSWTAKENVYAVNKIITANTLVVGSTLFKLEATYADVTNPDNIPRVKIDANTGQLILDPITNQPVIENKKISDYYHIGLGLEHTITQIYNEADLGLITEYYYYGITQKNNTFDDLDLFEIFQNDVFVGLRYSFNEGNDASILAGALVDLEYNEEVYSIEYESRIAEIFKLKIDYNYMNPSSTYPTAYALMGKNQRISVKLGYYF